MTTELDNDPCEESPLFCRTSSGESSDILTNFDEVPTCADEIYLPKIQPTAGNRNTATMLSAFRSIARQPRAVSYSAFMRVFEFVV